MLASSSIQFLRELKENNNKPWFDTQRKRYESMREDYLSLATNILIEMQKYDVSLEHVKAKECIFRINKDIRFSKDKTPYKTNLGIGLHPFGKKSNLAAYYIHIEEGLSFIGGGLWMPEAPLLAKVRKEIHYFYDDLKAIISDEKFKKTFKDLDIEANQKLTKPPKGYEINDPAIEYLKLKSFTVSVPFPDKMITDQNLTHFIVEKLKIISPFIHFINRGLMSDADGGI
jgi:uncharacterized protein (TIGR02453 family)